MNSSRKDFGVLIIRKWNSIRWKFLNNQSFDASSLQPLNGTGNDWWTLRIVQIQIKLDVSRTYFHNENKVDSINNYFVRYGNAYTINWMSHPILAQCIKIRRVLFLVDLICERFLWKFMKNLSQHFYYDLVAFFFITRNS